MGLLSSQKLSDATIGPSSKALNLHLLSSSFGYNCLQKWVNEHAVQKACLVKIRTQDRSAALLFRNFF